MTKKQDKNSDIEAMSFEAAMGELEKIVSQLEKGDVALEESISLYERGETLKKKCDSLLKAAENRVEVLQKNNDNGDISSTPFEDQA